LFDYKQMKIKTIPLKGRDIELPEAHAEKPRKEDIPGYHLVPVLNPNILLLAKKRSGKTTVIFNLLKGLITANHKVFIFSGTYRKDDTWQSIIDWLDNEGVIYYADTSFKGKDANGVPFNMLSRIMKMLETKPEEYYIMVFDDLPQTDYKDKTFDALFKQNRHSAITTISSDQYLNSMAPSTLTQMDLICMFPKLPEKKLIEIHGKLQPDITVEDFVSLYRYATAERYSFLYMLRDGPDGTDEYRKNFNVQLQPQRGGRKMLSDAERIAQYGKGEDEVEEEVEDEPDEYED